LRGPIREVTAGCSLHRYFKQSTCTAYSRLQ